MNITPTLIYFLNKYIKYVACSVCMCNLIYFWTNFVVMLCNVFLLIIMFKYFILLLCLIYL